MNGLRLKNKEKEHETVEQGKYISNSGMNELGFKNVKKEQKIGKRKGKGEINGHEV